MDPRNCRWEECEFFDVDGVVVKMKEMRNKFITNLLTDPINIIESVFSRDDSCHRRMNEGGFCCQGVGVCLGPLKCRYFACTSCRIISNFFYIDDSKFGVPLYTEFGEYKDRSVVIKKEKDQLLSTTDIQKDKTWIVGNEVTNEIFLTWILEYIFDTFEMEVLVQKILYSFQCRYTNYRIYEYFNYLENFSPEIVEGIFLQMITLFHCLKKYLFLYLSPNSRMFKFEPKKLSYSYQKIKVKCPVKLVLNNLGSSSIQVGQENGRTIQVMNGWVTKSPIFHCPVIIKEGLFLLENRDPISYMEQTGQIIGNSWNIYCSMIVLMANRSFSESFHSSRFYFLWEKMWLPEEIQIIESDLNIFRTKGSIETEEVYSIMYHRHLNMDWLEQTMEYLEEL
jgi:hypothetical protein